ncbi:MAG: histone deacetylase [Methanomicrobia archaeon]|nr:histone deacetylase [Methanomicrobia archaeon]
MNAATGFVYHEDYLRHDTGYHGEYEPHIDTGYHPESAERLISIMRGMEERNLTKKIERIHPVRASREQIEYVHTPAYVQKVEALCKSGGGMLDPDTPLCSATYDIALLAAGGLIKAVDEVMDESNELRRIFALVRPPGHHANSTRGRGFCIFNNVAIAAEQLKREYGAKRILIADWDVHHGNGTQEVFFEDPSVLYFSIHQYPHYPGTGWINEVGKGDGTGFTVNVPLPIGTDDAGYLYAFTSILVPIAREFRPEVVLVSSGFDAHVADPLASMAVTSQGFGLFTDVIMAIANELCKGRIVMTLEGGYDLNAIAESVLAVFNSLIADNGDLRNRIIGPNERVMTRIAEIKTVQKVYWNL